MTGYHKNFRLYLIIFKMKKKNLINKFHSILFIYQIKTKIT